MANVFTPDDIDFAAYEHETDAQQKVLPASSWVQAVSYTHLTLPTKA